ncbi:nitrilase and fragile histidine triad fusion protein NitFhit-like [Tropilaelaps mercedesae]|uniref:Nitrilase and fragile histidine triad fusion protein NitFhit n=1 Tax=Tropilaelaps mercedesae TaxID=418985 RepID=A0A1V9Y3N8_9ACAR|nr:nitrilase and fragile histidine triad fusion protein NitFhit-like [Tropilaelaps mercedesae]
MLRTGSRLVVSVTLSSISCGLIPCFTCSRTMASKEFHSTVKIALCQVTSTVKKEENFEKCSKLITDATSAGAKMVFLPECTDFVGERRSQIWDLAEPLDGPTISAYCKLAAINKIWISLGSMHIRPNAGDHNVEGLRRIRNTHVLINSKGTIAGTYDKVHLFDADLETLKIKESEFAISGAQMTAPIETPIGNVGLGICYDMRFPEFALSLAKSGAHVLTYPSAFTVSTGYAHWEALLRARAIETQCYVIAAAQVGQHNSKRFSYGHSIVIDPWGGIVAQSSDLTNQLIYAEINLEYVKAVRLGMPVMQHRRVDLYGEPTPVYNNTGIDSQEVYTFGQVELYKSQLFHKTALSMAFTNIMPILTGHVLVAPLRRSAIRLADITSGEIADLFDLVVKVQKAVETEYQANDSTISIQDGALAGRSIDHLHVHILPRHKGDFKRDNDVYVELQDHKSKKRVRSQEEMAEEALRLRKYFP